VVLPQGSVKSDWEVELGIVIGSKARYVSEADALAHVAGYCVVNDVSEREYQIERGGTWDKGKGCDTFGPVGPWLVTADEIARPAGLDMWLDVNGHRYQKGSTKTMIFGVAQLVSYVSRFMTLYPGDLITTGTPPGVGMGVKPGPVYLKAGRHDALWHPGPGRAAQRSCTPGTRHSSTADRDEQPGDPHPRQRQRRHRAPQLLGGTVLAERRRHRLRPGAARPQGGHRAIAAGEAVRRYDQIIGSATQAIAPGQHVHTHNLAFSRLRARTSPVRARRPRPTPPRRPPSRASCAPTAAWPRATTSAC
jgi:hypothetical protein